MWFLQTSARFAASTGMYNLPYLSLLILGVHAYRQACPPFRQSRQTLQLRGLRFMGVCTSSFVPF